MSCWVQVKTALGKSLQGDSEEQFLRIACMQVQLGINSSEMRDKIRCQGFFFDFFEAFHSVGFNVFHNHTQFCFQFYFEHSAYRLSDRFCLVGYGACKNFEHFGLAMQCKLICLRVGFKSSFVGGMFVRSREGLPLGIVAGRKTFAAASLGCLSLRRASSMSLPSLSRKDGFGPVSFWYATTSTMLSMVSTTFSFFRLGKSADVLKWFQGVPSAVQIRTKKGIHRAEIFKVTSSSPE